MHKLLKMMESRELVDKIDPYATPVCIGLLILAGVYFFGQLAYALVITGRITEVTR
jgi:hypothetical protein